MALSIDNVNTKASKATLFGWVVGLIWIGYFNSFPNLSLLDWIILIVAGMFGASIIIGGGISLLFAGITRLVYGRADATPIFFAWGVIISPIIAYFCVGPVARLLN